MMRGQMIEWTEAQIETMKAMLKDGASFSEIGAELGCSRNSAIGKAHRLKLYAPQKHGGRREPKSRGSEVRIVKTVRKPPKPPVIVKTPETVEPVDIEPDDGQDVTHLVGILDLDNRVCRWPIGDPQTKEFGFCGCPVKPGSVYCEPHHRRAHNSAFAEA